MAGCEHFASNASRSSGDDGLDGELHSDGRLADRHAAHQPGQRLPPRLWNDCPGSKLSAGIKRRVQAPQAFARRAALQQLSLFRSGGYKWHNHSSFKIENAVLYLKNWRILSLARDRTEKALHIYLITR
jgi:hypothetical protein